MAVMYLKYRADLRNKNGLIEGYVLEDSCGNIYKYTSNYVKQQMEFGNLQVEGLELTSDYRLIKKKIASTVMTAASVAHPFIIPRELIKKINSKGKILLFRAASAENLKGYVANYKSKIRKNEFGQPYTVVTNAEYVCVIGMGTHMELPVDSSYMFSNTVFDIINLTDVYSDRVENMDNMFRGSKSKILLPNTFSTRNVKSMIGMFSYCQCESLDIKMFDTSNVRNMSRMFEGAGIHWLDLAGMNTRNVVKMTSMFERAFIDTLTMPLCLFTHSLEDMTSMFEGAVIIRMNFQNFFLNHKVEHKNILKNHHINGQLPTALTQIASGKIPNTNQKYPF